MPALWLSLIPAGTVLAEETAYGDVNGDPIISEQQITLKQSDETDMAGESNTSTSVDIQEKTIPEESGIIETDENEDDSNVPVTKDTCSDMNDLFCIENNELNAELRGDSHPLR